MAQLRGSLLPADSAEPAKRKVRQRTVQIGEDGSRLFRTQEKIKVGADPEGAGLAQADYESGDYPYLFRYGLWLLKFPGR